MLDACAELVDEIGYEALTTTLLAERAGVAIGSIYQFFPDKRAVVQALTLRNLEAYLERLAARFTESILSHWWDGVEVAIDEYIDMHRTVPGFRTLHFGDVVDVHLLDEERDNNAVIASALVKLLTDRLDMPRGPHLDFALMIAVPLTLLIVILIIYLNTCSAIKTAIVMLAVPFSLVGAIGILAVLHYNLSVAVWVGIIALAGLDAETGVVMLLYLDIAFDDWRKKGLMRNLTDLRDAIYHGAVKRVRPKAMTACVIIAGLAPILWSHGTGADVMKRIATPMVGGVVTSTIMELLVYPAIFYLWRSRALGRTSEESANTR